MADPTLILRFWLAAELARCDAEIEAYRNDPGNVATAPAHLVRLGIQDWEHEKRLIVREYEKSAKV